MTRQEDAGTGRGGVMRFISFGAGVQSSALLLMSDRGMIDRADYAIFSDTGAEPKAVYDWLEFIRTQVTIPVVVTNNGDLYADIIRGERFASIPFFTQDKAGEVGIVRRQCTKEYKITPVQRKVRELMGYKPRQRIKEPAEVMIGISSDEVFRMKPPLGAGVGWEGEGIDGSKRRIQAKGPGESVG